MPCSTNRPATCRSTPPERSRIFSRVTDRSTGHFSAGAARTPQLRQPALREADTGRPFRGTLHRKRKSPDSWSRSSSATTSASPTCCGRGWTSHRPSPSSPETYIRHARPVDRGLPEDDRSDLAAGAPQVRLTSDVPHPGTAAASKVGTATSSPLTPYGPASPRPSSYDCAPAEFLLPPASRPLQYTARPATATATSPSG